MNVTRDFFYTHNPENRQDKRTVVGLFKINVCAVGGKKFL